MGCCVSTDKNSTFQKHESLKPFESGHDSRAPPPSLDELETVKEVLSETPKPKPTPQAPPVKKSHQEESQHQECKEGNNNERKSRVEQPPFLEKKAENERMFQLEEVSGEQGSVCSLSFSGSVSTTTINNEKGDYFDGGVDDQEVKQRVTRSPATRLPLRSRGDLGPRSDHRTVAKSPIRRPEQSPSKRNTGFGGGDSVRMVHSREPGMGQVGRRGLRSDPNRRDPGESSGRRSRSPATNRSMVGRCPSNRRANQSPGRIQKDPHEDSSTYGGSKGENGLEAKNKRPGTNSGDFTTNESLENPLVSLECFIFL